MHNPQTSTFTSKPSGRPQTASVSEDLLAVRTSWQREDPLSALCKLSLCEEGRVEYSRADGPCQHVVDFKQDNSLSQHVVEVAARDSSGYRINL